MLVRCCGRAVATGGPPRRAARSRREPVFTYGQAVIEALGILRRVKDPDRPLSDESTEPLQAGILTYLDMSHQGAIAVNGRSKSPSSLIMVPMTRAVASIYVRIGT